MPKNVCDRCKQDKTAQLCAGDLPCHECYLENERQLTAIREVKSAGPSKMAAVGSADDESVEEQSARMVN
jgi:protein-arginine kinase activator protein McsA